MGIINEVPRHRENSALKHPINQKERNDARSRRGPCKWSQNFKDLGNDGEEPFPAFSTLL